MPALNFLNKRWRIGSDDFVYPCIFEVVIRLTWLILSIVLIVEHEKDEPDDPECHSGKSFMRIYLYGLLVLLLMNLSTAIALIIHSAQGTITKTYPRRHVPRILLVRLCFGLIEVVWNILGTIWVFSGLISCKVFSSLWFLIKAHIVFTWVATCIIIVCAYFLFEPMMRPDTSFRTKSFMDRDTGPGVFYIEKWEKRCRLLCCAFSKDEEIRDAFRGIADVVASFFEGTNLVTSDILAALVLLRLKRKHEEIKEDAQQLFQGIVVSPTLVQEGNISPDSPPAWMTIANAQHFMKFALGSYGWPWFLHGRMFSACWSLRKYIKCCSCCRTKFENDNCCSCNMAALRATTNLLEENIIYVSFHNKIYEPPFFVAIDEESQHIVISIRGTLSLKDAITDLNALSAPICEDLPPMFLAHKGIVRSSLFVIKKLQETQALNQAFEMKPNFSLVVTGHSLGAGVAVILSTILRPQYPTLKCFAFSPPGGLCSKEFANSTQDYVFSVVVGDDLVPRLSRTCVTDLHQTILTELRACQRPKYRILANGCWYMFCGISKSSLQNSAPVEDNCTPSQEDLLPEESIESSYESVSLPPNGVSSRSCDKPLYLPGRILHIIQRFPESKENPWLARWSEASKFQQIVISPNMLRHHLPPQVLSTLNTL